MQLDINDEEKIQIGYYIDYLRNLHKSENHEDYKIQKFIENICSKETYNKISKGKIIKESGIYDSLLNKLGYKYNYSNNIYKEYHSDFLEIINYLEEDKMDATILRLEEYCMQMEAHGDDPFKRIIYDASKILTNCMKQNYQLENHEFQFLYKMTRCVSKEFKEIIIYFIANYIYEYSATEKEIDLLINEIGIAESKYLFNKNAYLSILTRIEQFYDATILCEEIIEIANRENKKEQLLKAIISKCFLFSCIQPSKMEDIISYIKKTEVQDTENNYQYAAINHMIGLYYFTREKEKSYLYFVESSRHKKFLFPEIIFINHLHSLYGFEIPRKLAEEKDLSNYQKEWRVLYEFYNLKNSGEDIPTLEDYILEKCKYVIKEFYPSKVIKDILQLELKKLTLISGNKYKLYNFSKSRY